MKDASQYPITTPYGNVPGYPLNNGFHNGIDYGCPTGTPIVVNGVTIGLSGATGYVTGPHLHVGKWSGGTVMDPGVGGGFHFNSAKVTEINEDATNGKYVRVQGDGYSWVYLHMSDNNKVSVGQVLEGDDMADKVDVNMSRVLQHGILGRNGLDGRPDALAGQTDSPWVGEELTASFVMSIYNSPEAQQWRGSQTDPTSIVGINKQLKQKDSDYVEATVYVKKGDIK